MASFILSAAIRAVKSRIGIWRAYDSITDIVPEVSRAEWSHAVGEARAALANRLSELTRPLNRRPVTGEITSIERKSSAKYWQQVEVFIRDRDTGARSIMHFTSRTETLRSRMAIVRDWVEHVSALAASKPDDYPIDIIGWAYTGTYEIRPPVSR